MKRTWKSSEVAVMSEEREELRGTDRKTTVWYPVVVRASVEERKVMSSTALLQRPLTPVCQL